MGKNIIICCDGTDNMLTTKENTNVLHIYSCLAKNQDQVAYYNPGVGTLDSKLRKNSFWGKIRRIKDKIIASSLDSIVIDAYEYLMHHYEEGDLIYMFGFSRGAYTVRMLCGMLDLYGLMDKGNENHLKYILHEYYINDENKWEIASKFKKRFSRPVSVHFLGIWDTVVSVGGPLTVYPTFPNSKKLAIVDHVRHAVSIDERRKHFRLESIDKMNHVETDKEGKLLKSSFEVYFTGVHSDVGGSYKEEGLSKISLKWMLGEATNLGLRVEKKKVARYVFGSDKRTTYQPPDLSIPIHVSYHDDFNWLLDWIPRKRSYVVKKSKKSPKILMTYFDWAIGPSRFIPLKSLFHESVKLKLNFKENNPIYTPKNLKFEILSEFTLTDQAICYLE